jgi:four helix bundle protein
MKDFKKLLIWEKGMDIVAESYAICKKLPKEEKFSLIAQITSAAVSIPLNIAEGSSRKSNKDYLRFLEYSLGSAFELETLIHVISRLKMVKEADIKIILEKVIQEQKMIQSFMNTINK